MSRLGAEALLCAERGWHVFPCSPKDKAPLNEHGLNDATLDRTIIEQWWRQWPRAMIGVRTGPESGIFAIDLDIDPEKGLEASPLSKPCRTAANFPRRSSR